MADLHAVIALIRKRLVANWGRRPIRCPKLNGDNGGVGLTLTTHLVPRPGCCGNPAGSPMAAP